MASDRSRAVRLLRRLAGQKDLQAMALVGLAWMIIFNYLPMYGIIIAFKNYNILKPILAAPWAGLEHFREFFTDGSFVRVMSNTLGINGLRLLVGFPLPILFAILLSEMIWPRLKRVVQTISYLPHFVSWVILGGMLVTWLSDVGIVNAVLTKAGIIREPIFYLAEPKYFWWIAVISDTWKELGWSAIIYLAAITGIDPELYEAATIDGATRLQKTRYVTIPCIRGAIAIMFVLTVSYLLNSNFDQIFVLKNQLNAPASDVIDIYVYRMGLQAGRFSYSAAIGLFKSVIALGLLVLSNRVAKRLTGASIF
jgi:putative aldouronate transport system permease protein